MKIQREVGIIQCQNCSNKKGQQFNAKQVEFRKQIQQDADRGRSAVKEDREEEDAGTGRVRLEKKEKGGNLEKKVSEVKSELKGWKRWEDLKK